ncbi:hypothetical protein VPH35_048070 [Triticum aestivum]|uniref:Uncharacterized protein n=1 Tax=Triticum urartu TaxID=4572 RepID=A0A8R7U2L9_TRIUA
MSRFWTCSIQMQQIYKALLCVQDNPNDCPFISSVVYILENGSAKLHVPNQPVYSAPTNSKVEHATGNTQNSKNMPTYSSREKIGQLSHYKIFCIGGLRSDSCKGGWLWVLQRPNLMLPHCFVMCKLSF